MARPGPKRKINVIRSRNGKSRGEPEVIAPEVLAVRRKFLEQDRVDPKNAADPLASYTLGRLLLRNRKNDQDPGSISQEQYEAGEAWAKIVHRHASIMGYNLTTRSPSFVMVGTGLSCGSEPEEDEILRVRRKYSDCYNALMEVCRDHGLRVRDVVYGVCVENWPVGQLGPAEYGCLRIGLNAIGRALTKPREHSR